MSRQAWVRPVRSESHPEPPAEKANPMQDALHKWEDLKRYAIETAEKLKQSNEDRDRLSLENEALRDEITHVREYMGQQIAAEHRDNQLLRSFSERLRTRLSTIRETIDAAENESIQFARDNADTPQQAEEQRQVSHIHDGIVRVNQRTSEPQN